MFGTSVNLKFREKYRNRRRLVMPLTTNLATSSTDTLVSARSGRSTPTGSSIFSRRSSPNTSPSTSVASLHDVKTPYDQSQDVFASIPAEVKPSMRVRSRGGSRRPVVHIHFDKVHVGPLSPGAAKPAMVDAGVQAGAPQVPIEQTGFMGLLERLKRWSAPAKPVWDFVSVIALFFLDRVGFGVRLN